MNTNTMIIDSFSELQEFVLSKGITDFRVKAKSVELADMLKFVIETLFKIAPNDQSRFVINTNLTSEDGGDTHSVCFLIDTDSVWGKFYNLYRYLKTNNKFEYSDNSFKKMIEASSRKITTAKRDTRLFELFRTTYRISRAGRAGFRKFLPEIKRIGRIRDGDQRWGMSYAKEFSSHIDRSEIAKVIANLTNERSRNIYKTVLHGCAEEVWRMYFDNMLNHPQYCDYLQWEPGMVVLNGGVFTGSEIPFFVSKSPKIIYHVDPTGEAFLSDYVRTYVDNDTSQTSHVFCKEMLSDKCDVVQVIKGDQYRISTTEEDISNLNASDRSITINALYAKYNIKRIDIHKYDLEGAEMLILNDLVSKVATERSQVAISIYHGLDHFTKIPLAFMNGLEGYSFYVEHYSYESMETILYCIPKERERNAIS